MMEVWSGSIAIDDSQARLQDVHFWAPSSFGCDLLCSSITLRFLSKVHVPSIPLYLAVGPSLEVSTDDDGTASWLNDQLVIGEGLASREVCSLSPWWAQASKQLHQGVLLKVEGRVVAQNVTEVLLYAMTNTQDRGLPTPPGSSPPPARESSSMLQDDADIPIKLFALPLCSDIITRAGRAAQSCSSELSTIDECRFLPTGALNDPLPSKRQRLSDKFDDASQQRRKLKGRGGERVSKVMAGGGKHQEEASELKASIGKGAAISTMNPKGSDQNNLSRTSSIISLPETIDTRPVFRGMLPNGKRSSLHRVESAISPRELSAVPNADSNFALQNKAALTKIVMTGMRLHGLQQKKKHGSILDRRPVTSDGTSGAEALNEVDDEYKLIYHQTFKAAAFTFRLSLSERFLGNDVMRDVVDRLLGLFCSDPAIVNTAHEDFLQAPQREQVDTSSAFDLPRSIVSAQGSTTLRCTASGPLQSRDTKDPPASVNEHG